MTTPDLKLYLVDDDDGARRSVGMLLLSRGYSVQMFDSGETFLAQAALQQCGCVVLDLRMEPGMSGLQVFDVLRQRKSPLLVLFLSAHGDIGTAVEAVQSGAFGWVEKNPNDETKLLEKVALAVEQAAKRAQDLQSMRSASDRWARLTEREREIAPLLAKGLTSKEIAKALSPVEYRTIDTHRARIFEKLEVANAIELGHFMRECGL